MISERSIQQPLRADDEPVGLRFPRGAEILIEALGHEGVDTIFGYPGGAVLHIYDELWRGPGPDYALPRASRTRGRTHGRRLRAVVGESGVALVTSGPAPRMRSLESPTLTWIRRRWS
jgi:Thiamine pyrophosphate-requiring enzymes [acetolactate synthase, pyruvate dehydrogenase (cytochrome), glyoxylate carboligase, phosphonopyruvate decarboxylase]